MKSKEDKEHKKNMRKLKKDMAKQIVKNSWRKYDDTCEYVFIKVYEIYRAWSSWVFILFFLYFLIIGNFIMAFISVGFVHLHLLYNQIWHKLKQVIFYYQNSLYIKDNGEQTNDDERFKSK